MPFEPTAAEPSSDFAVLLEELAKELSREQPRAPTQRPERSRSPVPAQDGDPFEGLLVAFDEDLQARGMPALGRATPPVAAKRPRSPVPDYLLQQQRGGIPNGDDANPSPGVRTLNALGDVGRFGAEMTGVPSVVRGVRHLTDENGDGWTKAKGAGEVVLGAMPGLTVVRGAAPVLNALAGTVPRALGTIAGATVPSVVVGAREDGKAAADVLSNIQPPDYMTKELNDLKAQKAAKQQEFNTLNQKHARSGPETQRQALDPLHADLADLNAKIADAEGRARQYLAGETEKMRQQLPFRQRYPGAAEAIGGGAAALSTFLPFASTMKTRIGNTVEGWLQGRAASKADALFEAGKYPAFVEAQNALGKRIENLDNATTGASYDILGAKAGDVAKAVGLGTLLNFEGAAIPEQVDALAFPPGHPTRERARDELTKPDYYASRAIPALLWGAGTTGLGAEAGSLMTPGGKVPERAREVVRRGSPESIADLERITRYVQAREAAQNGGRLTGTAQQRSGAAQQLEAAASAPVPPVRAETFGQPSQSVAPVANQPNGPSLVERMAGGRNALGEPAPAQRQLPSPAASPSRPAPDLPSWASEPPRGVTLPQNTYWDANRNQPRHRDGTYVQMPK